MPNRIFSSALFGLGVICLLTHPSQAQVPTQVQKPDEGESSDDNFLGLVSESATEESVLVDSDNNQWQLAGDSSPVSQFASGMTLLDVTNFEAGKYLLTVDASGRIEVAKVNIVQIGEDPPGEDPPSTSKERVKRLEKVVDQINDPEMTKNLVPLFRGIAIKARPPNAVYNTSEKLQTVVQDGLNLFLSISGSSTKWKPFKDTLSAEWTTIVQEGGAAEHRKLTDLVDDVADALSSSAELDEAAFDITVVFKILDIIGDESLSRWQKIVALGPLILSLFI